MNKIAIAVSVLLAPVFVVAQTQNSASVSGKWKIHSSVAGNESDSECTFAQSGTDLTGSCSTMGSDLKITGKVEGIKISWSYDSEYNGGPLTMQYAGTLSSGRITGQVNVVQYGVDGDFTATPDTSVNAPGIAPGAAAGSAPAAAPGSATAASGQSQGSASLNGKWKIHSSIAGNDSDSECTFAQAGTDLTGSCSMMNSSLKITGKVDGVNISWSYDSQYNGNPLTMQYTGTLHSGKITGQVTVVQYGVSGDFTATLEN